MYIKKTSQYIEGGASLSNTYGTSNENGYTQDYINGLNTYSTTEQRIGTWIDGKPLYQKTVVIDNVNISNGTSINHNITNIDFIVDWNLIFTSNQLPNNFYHDFAYYRTKYSVGISRLSKTDIQFATQDDSGNLTNIKLYFTMKYTKTTD